LAQEAPIDREEWNGTRRARSAQADVKGALGLLSGAKRRLGHFNETVGVSGRNLAGAILVAMTAIILVQVISRYVFNNSISWTEQLSKSLMVWTAFLVAPWAYRHGANVSISLLAEATPFRMQTAIRLVITLLVMWISGVFFVESLEFTARGMRNEMATLPVPSGVFYLIIPISLAGMLLVGVEMILRDLIELVTGEADASSPEHLSRREA
jgi:TRAP-type C4-dicarboxylate transport system permease small subunit